MAYLHRPDWPHKCTPPVGDNHRPIDPAGTIWRCDVPTCMRYWHVEELMSSRAWFSISDRRARRLLKKVRRS